MGKHKDKSRKHKREKKHKEKKKKHKKRKSSSSSSSEEWVEKESYSSSDNESPAEVNKNILISDHRCDDQATIETKRNEWMTLPTSFLTESNLERRKNREESKRLERERAQYNPRECVRELNPYWKDGGDGLPKFKKPSENNEFSKYEGSSSSGYYNRPKSTSNWRKKPPTNIIEHEIKSDTEPSQECSKEVSSEVLSDKELNILASKLVKAEIMGKTALAKELKDKLENARKLRETMPNVTEREDVLLTQTDSKGHARPYKTEGDNGMYSEGQRKKRKVETHQDGQRVRFFPDDDKHSLKQMFENEKYNLGQDQDDEFMRMASKVKHNDDLDEIFADNIRKKVSNEKVDSRNRSKAISEHHRVSQSLDNCKYCLQSNLSKHLMITLKETCFLSLPSHEPLMKGHCLIVPIRHVSCSTLLDENEWAEIMDFRKLLTQMYNSKDEDVIFFETAKHLDKYPHMYIECIPINKEEGDMAPIYFKKAIDECEAEWAQNKKLVSLKNRDVRKAIPKGLPYFFVSFGMNEGYAHVIEDVKSFPSNFAPEIIGGMLDLHHSKWRKPRQETFDEQKQRVLEFSQKWSSFEDTS